MNNEKNITINGLIDGISVLENKTDEVPYLKDDIIFNENEPITMFEDFHKDEFIFSDFNYESCFEGVNLTSNYDEIIDTSEVCDTI